MSRAIDQFDVAARAKVGAHARTTIHRGELLRHPAYTRVLHWSVAAFFVLALLSGFAIYTPWLYHWLTPIFGGGPATRALHPWFSLGFIVAFAAQLANWAGPMSGTPDDRRGLGHLERYNSYAPVDRPAS